MMLFQIGPQDVSLAVVVEQVHLALVNAPVGIRVALCGAALGASYKAFRFFIVEQVTCKECRDEYGKQTKGVENDSGT